MRGVCSVPDCDRPHWGHGFCETHARRHYRNGDAQPDKPILARRLRPQPHGMPEPLGPITTTPYDEDGARDRAADAAFSEPHTPRASVKS